MRHFLVLILISAVIGLIAACGASATPTPLPTATPAPTPTPAPQINEVAVTGFDHGFNSLATIPAGMTTFTFTNEGQDLHHQQLITVPEGMSPEDLFAALAAEGPPPPGMEAAGGVGVLAPGGVGSVTLDMAPGAYVMVCFLPNAEGIPHAALGMVANLTVTEAEGPKAAAPEADVSLVMVDFSFGFSAPVASGTQTIAVSNSGTQDHEAFLVRLMPDKTAEDFIVWVEEFSGPPPGEPLGGLQAVSPGRSGFISADFTPGNYFLVCFIEDIETGTPHFVFGMVNEFTVQ